jgi:hypothetical protein
LETAKQILQEVFQAQPGEVDEMIQKKLRRAGRRSARRDGGPSGSA